MSTSARFRAFSPTGQLITRVEMVIRARADIYWDSFHRDEYGQLSYDHAGSTEIK